MAQDCFLTFGICRQMIMMQPGKLSILPLESKQWGVFQINNGSGSFQLPLSSTILNGHIQHCGVSAQYNGLDGTMVVSSLNTKETLFFLVICK